MGASLGSWLVSRYGRPRSNMPNTADPNGTPEEAELAALASALASHARRRTWLGETRELCALPRAPAPHAAPLGSPGAPAALAGFDLFDARSPGAPARGPNAALAATCADLAELERAVAACRVCGLCDTRTQTVFADGSGRARVMFIGEAPGEQEDLRGLPFVGPAGQLLTDIIEKGMGLARADVYIANVLKCRPPGNRDPAPQETSSCTPFLDRQIELVAPEVIITLGLHASQHVLGSTQSIGRLRGRVHRTRGRRVVATYHPAYLLRNPSAKKDCWSDVKLAMTELGLVPPARGTRSTR
jgi:DNA polymerase